MRTRRWLATAAAGVAITMVAMSGAWACGNMATADMTLKNVGGSWPGKNYTYCTIGQMLAATHTTPCQQEVSVKGTNFENNIETKLIEKVDLYWLDEPFYAAGLGGPNGVAEQAESTLCMTKGVKIGSATVTNKTFETTVTVPPTKPTTEDGTLPRVGARPDLGSPGTYVANSGKFTWGLNAICAVWDHEVAGAVHQGSIGNGYNVWF